MVQEDVEFGGVALQVLGEGEKRFIDFGRIHIKKGIFVSIRRGQVNQQATSAADRSISDLRTLVRESTASI